MSLLAELEQQLEGRSEDELVKLRDKARESIGVRRWIPNEGPQMDAFFNKADLVWYGGEGGGGKSDLLLGLATTEHKRSLILRRQYTDIASLTDRVIEINGSRTGFNGSSPPRLTTADKRIVDFGAVKDPSALDTWQGKARDFLGIDEAVQFPEVIIRTLMGWVRSTDSEQRCRVVMASNPPLSDEGEWIIRMFAPWVDKQHPNPAKPGELRWYVTNEHGDDVAVGGPGVYEYDAEGYPVISDRNKNDMLAYEAQSRTFIRARLSDNPQLSETGYKRTLDNLPEPLRSALRDGVMTGARRDHYDQLIPSEWISASQAQWTAKPPADAPMSAMGVDVAGGGADENVIAPRYSGWFGELLVEPGRKIVAGSEKAGWIMQNRLHGAEVVIDTGGGYGDSAYERLCENLDPDGGTIVHGYKGSRASTGKSVEGNRGFFNLRAEVFYRLREALDPDQPGGAQIILPPDPILFGELCSIRMDNRHMDMHTLKLETKKNLILRVGKSPNRADAVALAWHKGPRVATHWNEWRQARPGQKPKVNTSRRSAKRLRKR